MQEEIENRTISLAIATTRLTAEAIGTAVQNYLRDQRETKYRNDEKHPTGKQTVKQLIGQGEGVNSMDISQTDLKGFLRYARKYGVDYAIRKDKSKDPPSYFVFFKSKDADALAAAFKEYMTDVMNKSKKPSTLAQLRQLRDKVIELSEKAIEKVRGREVSR